MLLSGHAPRGVRAPRGALGAGLRRGPRDPGPRAGEDASPWTRVRTRCGSALHSVTRVLNGTCGAVPTTRSRFFVEVRLPLTLRQVSKPKDVPAEDLAVFQHGWTAMLVMLLIEVAQRERAGRSRLSFRRNLKNTEVHAVSHCFTSVMLHASIFHQL